MGKCKHESKFKLKITYREHYTVMVVENALFKVFHKLNKKPTYNYIF